MQNAEDMLVSVMRRDKAKKQRTTVSQTAVSPATRAEARKLRKQLRQVLADVKMGRHPADLADAVEDAIFMADKLYLELGARRNA